MNIITKLLSIQFSLIVLSFIITNFIPSIYAQEFEFNAEDYFYSEQNPTNSKDVPTILPDSEDTDKENCVDNPMDSLSLPNSGINSDSYTSEFHFIKKFDRDGNLIGSWGTVGSNDGQFLHAHGITIDSQDNVYVSDAENCNIQKFDKDGNYITKWGTKGIGPGKFLQPESMAVDSLNNIYVAEYSRKNIQKFDSEGNFITMWGQEGSGEGEFKKPWGVALDSKDNVYVSDQTLPRVQKFDSDGNFITMWGSLGCKDDQFLIPHDIAIDSEGYIYVTESGKSHFRANYDCNNASQ